MSTTAAGARIDLNADVGEGCDDAALVPLVTSANVSCGAHAGDDALIRATLRIARAHRVAVGAHPSFPDRPSFGRRITTRDPATITDFVAVQVGHLVALAAAEGITLEHVKAHGALYNLAAADRTIAGALAVGVARVLPRTRLVVLAGSCALAAAHDAGLVPVAEAFVDRAYLDDGTLAPRDLPDAVVHDPNAAARRAVLLARDGLVETMTGRTLRLTAETLCLHGDTTGAIAIARAVRAALSAAGVAVEHVAT